METHKGRKPHLIIVVMQRQAPTPSHHCFLQEPTYRRLYPQFCKLKLARKHQLPSIFCRHQPTGGSNLSQLQLTAIKLQIDREASTSSIYQTECLLIYLWYQLCSVAYLSALLFLIFSASLFCILPSLYLLSLSLVHIKLILYIEILTWLFVFLKEFGVNSHDSLASVFLFLYPTQF